MSSQSFFFNFNSRDIASRQRSLNMKHWNIITVIGVGGIGSWVAFDLALSGRVDTLILFDPDIIETSNLNRTPFKISDVGKFKVDAMAALIYERRLDTALITFNEKFKFKVFKKTIEERLSSSSRIYNSCVIDCRDDLYPDLEEISKVCKVWKLGYDGLEITIDGCPEKTKVWGQSHGYEVTPSFICPSQLAANLVTNHILLNPFLSKEEHASEYRDGVHYDSLDLISDFVTFDSGDLLHGIFANQKHFESNQQKPAKSKKKSKTSKIQKVEEVELI